MDLVRLQLVANESDILCLHTLTPLVGALAASRFPLPPSQKHRLHFVFLCFNSGRKGLAVDALKNSRVLFLIPLDQWEDLDINNSMKLSIKVPLVM